jgi:hypothetical protein
MIISTQVAEGLEKTDEYTARVVPPDDIDALENEILKFMTSFNKTENISNINDSSVSQITKSLIELACYSE